MLLVYPPVVKPCEPPPGIARLAGSLRSRGIRCNVLDANLEGLLGLMDTVPDASDKWTARALRNRESNLAELRSIEGYRGIDRYKRTVTDLNRLVEKAVSPRACDSSASISLRVGLSNYQDTQRSPVRSSDLIQASEHPEENPFYPYFSKRLAELLERDAVTVIGVSLSFLSQALCTFAMLGFLRRECPGVKLVLGGGLVTSWMRRPGWKNPFEGLVDHLVDGPGETFLLSILSRSGHAVESGGLANGLDGTDSHKDHSFPDYSSFPLENYLSPAPILPYSASSGCYWSQCAFCPEKAEGNPYLPVPAGKVAQDLRTLVAAVKPVLIHLLDNAVSPSLMKALCASPPGVPWYGFARITRHLADPGFCMDLKRSGCVMLKLGIESGDQTVLDLERKGVALETVSKALRAIKEAGIATYVYLLFGTPSETLVEARKTLEFTVRHSEWIDFLNLAIFNLPVYGPEASRLETMMLYEGDLSLYTGFKHPKGWDRGLVRQFLDKEFKRHSAIASIIRRDPPFFTSNHAPFLRGTLPAR
jgi:radical SAM superfamily enzyme YgiQ (UPF0313 family)